MLIPAIDLMGGKVVQLVNGERPALEFDDPEEWLERFSGYPLIQLIDLDAAKDRGDNASTVARLVRRAPCQVGGGVRTIAGAEAMLALGAERVIVGSALVGDGAVDTAFAASLAAAVGRERLTFAVDSRGGRVAVAAWSRPTTLAADEMMRELEPYCSAFLYTNVDTEGLMQGFPLDVAARLSAVTEARLIVAGGVSTRAEIAALDAMGVDAIVGMALYTAGSEAALP